MFSRKSFDEKKHPFRTKGTRSPKPYKKERAEIFMRELEETREMENKELNHYFDERE